VDKTKPLIQVNPGFVVRVHFELESCEVEPVVGEIHSSGQQSSSNTFTLPVVVHANSDSSDVSSARSVWKSFDTDQADDAILDDGDKVVMTVSLF
jgi:hypothetical protein